MTTFTADQIALQQHIEAANAAWVKECEERGATFYTTTVSDPAHWEGYDITTIAQYERHSLVMSIWDAYKDLHGFRPRHMGLDSMSMEELTALEKEIYDDLQQEMEEERAADEAEIEKMMEYGAPDRDTAVRWIQEERL